MYDTLYIKSYFKILNKVYKKPIIYVDNASTTQKPKILNKIINYIYDNVYSNINRGLYYLSKKIELLYENSRRKVNNLYNLNNIKYISIICKSATEALNYIIKGLIFEKIKNEVIITKLEHHSNFLPWLNIYIKKKINLLLLDINDNYLPSIKQYLKLINKNTTIISITHMSNVIGNLIPIKNYIIISNSHFISSIIDGTQAVVHNIIDLKELNCSCYIFTGHKVYGPSGIGLLIGCKKFISKLCPINLGGGSISNIDKKYNFKYSDLPFRLEAGTPLLTSIISLYYTLNWIKKFKFLINHELNLYRYLWINFKKNKNILFFTNFFISSRILIFNIRNFNSNDISYLLNKVGICIRSGTHCAMPILNILREKNLCRISLGLYITFKDIDLIKNYLNYIIKFNLFDII